MNLRQLLFISYVVISMSTWARAQTDIPDKWFSLLRSLVAINSSSDNPKGLQAVRSLLIDAFQRMGFEATRHELSNLHQVVSLELRGANPDILIVGHIDTVFPHTQTPSALRLSADSKRLIGPGVIDMKGGIVLALNALEDLQATGVLNRIRFVINDDEEIGSIYSKDKLIELASGMRSGLVLEPGLADGSVVYEESGVLWLELTVTGKASHAGLEPHLGLNACMELVHKINRINKISSQLNTTLVNIGVLSGGTKPNVVCDRASVKIDIRFWDSRELEWFLSELEKIRNTSSVFNATLRISPKASLQKLGSVPVMPRSAGHALFISAMEVALDLGIRLNGRSVAYSSDANHLASTGMNLLVGLGPFGGGMHTPEEFMLVDSYRSRLALLKSLLKKIAKGRIQ
jgi:glutamate carboxypeptidase